MKRFWKNLIVGVTAFSALAAVGVSLACSKPVAQEVNAAYNPGTIYIAIKPTDLSTYTVKANLNIGDGGQWWTYDAQATKYTYNNGQYYVLSCDIDTHYYGVDVMQIQLYDGSTWKDQKVPYSTWSSGDNFYGKMFVYDQNKFIDYSVDAVKTASVYVDFFDWGTRKLYSFETIGGYTLETRGSYPGADVAISDPDLKFNGGMLQKVEIEYAVLANAKFIYNANTGDVNKSDNMTLVNGAYYWHNGSAWTYDSSSFATAAAYVYDFNEARMAVPASGSTKQYSICGLNAKTWVDRYDAINDATAKGYIDAASINTYKDKESSGADYRYTYAEIMVTLRSRYATASGSNLITGTEDTTSMVTIVAIFVLSAFGITSFFIFQKKKKLIIK